MDKKNSFILYTDYKEHISRLDDREAGRLFKAIFSHVSGEETLELGAEGAMAFSFIKAQLDRDKKKYFEICEKRRESGKLGGRPPKPKQEADDPINRYFDYLHKIREKR